MSCRSVRAAVSSPWRLLSSLAIAVAAVLAAPPAHADDDAVGRAVEACLADADPRDGLAPGEFTRLFAAVKKERAEAWTFTAAIYLWATAIEGDIDANGTTASIDVPFSDIFDDLSGAFMGRFGARKGKWGILVDILWCEIEDSTTGPLGGTVDAEMDLFIGEVTGSYTVLERGKPEKGVFTLDAYAGARVYSAEVGITTALVSPEESETWVDPIVGLGARYRTDRWLFDLRADIGGFEISSDLCWSVTVGVAYRCTKVFWLAGGYRWLDIDFEGGPVLDIQLSGPFLALVFHW